MLFNSFTFPVFLPIVFVVYWFLLKNSFASCILYNWWDYRFLMYNKRDYIHTYYSTLETENQLPVLSSTTYLPFLGMSYYNIELFFPSIVSLFKPKKHNRFNEVGDYSYPDKEYHSDKKMKRKKINFHNKYFQQIVKLCQENKIKLLVYFPPIYKTEIYWENTNYSMVNLTNAFENIQYFYDEIHVNSKGKKRATRLIAKKFHK